MGMKFEYGQEDFDLNYGKKNWEILGLGLVRMAGKTLYYFSPSGSVQKAWLGMGGSKKNIFHRQAERK